MENYLFYHKLKNESVITVWKNGDSEKHIVGFDRQFFIEENLLTEYDLIEMRSVETDEILHTNKCLM